MHVNTIIPSGQMSTRGEFSNVLLMKVAVANLVQNISLIGGGALLA